MKLFVECRGKKYLDVAEMAYLWVKDTLGKLPEATARKL